ncbi:MAG: hypothetical protein WC428_07210 [Candidatus Paceibacterota bacterium]|jgi:uncharacterized protein (UPF0210 family)
MPNIELFGFSDPFDKEVRKRVIKALKGVVPEKDIVITEHNVKVTNVRGRLAPFIRLTTTPIPELNQAVEALKDIPFDLEVMLLQQFHSAKK